MYRKRWSSPPSRLRAVRPRTVVIVLLVHAVWFVEGVLYYQRPDWNDSFRVEVEGNLLKVFRVDTPNGGWGQSLEL